MTLFTRLCVEVVTESNSLGVTVEVTTLAVFCCSVALPVSSVTPDESRSVWVKVPVSVSVDQPGSFRVVARLPLVTSPVEPRVSVVVSVPVRVEPAPSMKVWMLVMVEALFSQSSGRSWRRRRPGCRWR